MTFKKTFLYPSIWLASACFGGMLSVLLGTHLYLSPTLPSVESLRDVRLQTPLRIYSSDDKLIGEIGEMRRTPIKHEDIPKGYIDALLSAEDAQFYSHNGVSIKGLLRAVSQLLISGDIQGGGSTITMQVARNFFLSKRQEFKRKFNEILLALRIERELTKEEILELYVNVIFLGNRAYGIHSAAQVYYGKPLNELNIAQLAMLAGMPKAPSTMNPIANPVRATQRRDWILGRMLELGKIDQATYEAAILDPVDVEYHGNALDFHAPFAAEMARQFALDQLGEKAYTDGYRIITTFDTELQKAAQRALVNGLLEYDQRHGYRGPEGQIETPKELYDHFLAFQRDVNAAPTDAEQAPSETAEGNTTDSPKQGAQQEGAEMIALNDLPEGLRPLYEEWEKTALEKLKGKSSYGGLHAAIVTYVYDQSLSAITQDGTQRIVTWERGLESAAPYITANRRGKNPEKAFDVAKPGDIIRLNLADPTKPEFQQLPEVEGALVSLNPNNGALYALVGGFDFQQSNFNRATQAKRQPGSNFKPFVYSAALENGFTAATMINDAPIVYEDSELESAWRPQNSSGKFYGPTRLREALYRSINLVSIRLLRNLGIDTAQDTIASFGINTGELPRDLSLALGAHAMHPIDVAAGYALFANGGYHIEPHYITKILDVNGEAVYEFIPPIVCRECENEAPAPVETDEIAEPSEVMPNVLDDQTTEAELAEINETEVDDAPIEQPIAKRTMSEETAFIMDSILKDAVVRGTATKARVLNRPDVAGKTGTTNNFSDAWFSGYAGGVVTTTWVGFDKVDTLGNREYGGTAALPIWIEYMQAALKGRPVVSLPRPPGLLSVRINPENGLRTSANNRKAVFEYFREDQLPEMEDSSQGLDVSSPDTLDDELDPGNIF